MTTHITDPDYEQCIVTFIDVLGFRSLINERSAADIRHVLATLRTSTEPPREPPPRHSDEIRLQSQAFAVAVSDAVVRVRVYETQYSDGAFFLELLDLLHAQIACINEGVLIRAGLAVGSAHVGLLGDGPIFGPAMVRAFQIESEEAIFPRVVVDDAAYMAFLTDERLRSEHNNFSEEQAYVDRLLRTGEDGTRFIDYLYSSKSEFDHPAEYAAFLARHANLIRDELASSHPGRVKRKFVWLARYHNEVVGTILRDFDSGERDPAEYDGVTGDDPAIYFRRLLVTV